MTDPQHTLVSLGFEQEGVSVPISRILPLKIVTETIKHSAKYGKIASSIREIGVVELPVVARDRQNRRKFILLDGHLRIEVLKDMGTQSVDCLLATDDEAFSYNKRVNRITIVQEHKMILEAVKRGVSEERLAKALNVNIKSIRAKKNLLEGICREAEKILRNKNVPMNSFLQLKKLRPIRQIEAAELMVAMNKFSVPYAKSLVAATPQDQLVDRKRRKKGLTARQVSLMEQESANLEREFRLAERSFATDHLDLVLAKGYIAKLLANAQVAAYLGKHHSAIRDEFQRLIES